MLVHLKIGGGQGGGGGGWFNPPILNIARHWPNIAKHFGLFIPQIFFDHCNARHCLNIWNLKGGPALQTMQNYNMICSPSCFSSDFTFIAVAFSATCLTSSQPVLSGAAPVLNALLPSPPYDPPWPKNLYNFSWSFSVILLNRKCEVRWHLQNYISQS